LSAKVLVVDDASFMRLNLKNILESEGFEIMGEGTNGQEAVQLYQAEKPDVVTMDITMPEMDGLAAMEKIMEIDPQAKVIMVSAMGQETYIKKAIMSGAKNFIVKPFKKEKIIETLNKVLAS